MSLRKRKQGENPAARPVDDPGAPITSDQLSYLKQLSQRAGDPDAYDESLTRGEAQKRIAALEVLLDREAHSGVERLPRT